MYLGATVQSVGDKTGISYCFTYSFRYLGGIVQLVVDMTSYFYCCKYIFRYLGVTVQLVVDKPGMLTVVHTVSGT